MTVFMVWPILTLLLAINEQQALAASPNFFVGIRIRNPEIMKQIENVQETFAEIINDESSTIKPAASVTAHITLTTLYTKQVTKTAADKRGTLNKDLEAAAREKLSVAMAGIRELKERKQSKKILLNFKGVGDFSKNTRNRNYYCNPTIFYARPGPASEKILRKIAALVRSQFSSTADGFEITGSANSDDDYVPHLTIMRSSNYRPPADKPEVTSEMATKDFGLEEMWGIEFCYAGGGKRAADGYYDCPIQLPLNDKSF